MYTPEMAQLICVQIAKGRSLVTTCKKLEISHTAVYAWLEKYEDFAASYALAREKAADYFAEQIIDLADDETIPPESRRLKVDARKWIASKLKPRKYGDKTILSNDPDNPIGSLALRLDTAISTRKMIDVTPTQIDTGEDLY